MTTNIDPQPVEDAIGSLQVALIDMFSDYEQLIASSSVQRDRERAQKHLEGTRHALERVEEAARILGHPVLRESRSRRA